MVVLVALRAEIDDEGGCRAGVDGGELIEGLLGHCIRSVVEAELDDGGALRKREGTETIFQCGCLFEIVDKQQVGAGYAVFISVCYASVGDTLAGR